MDSFLSDKAFTDKVLELYQLIYSKDAILLIDINNIILHAGKEIYQITRIQASELIGKNHFEVIPFPKENIDKVKGSIDKIINSQKPCEFLSINTNHSDDYIILHCIQKPIINPSTGNVIAFSVESKPLPPHIYLHKILYLLDENKRCIAIKQHNDELLSLREHEIAFLLFYCKSAKKIATTLSDFYSSEVSAKTVSNIISSQLYNKLNVYGIEALLNKLYELGYSRKIPASFILNTYLELD